MIEGGQNVSAVSRRFRILPGGTTGVSRDPSVARYGAARLIVESNPVRDRARFRFELPQASGSREAGGEEEWALSVFEPSGRLVRRFEILGPSLDWDLSGPAGRRLKSGAYLVVLSGPGGERVADSQRIVILR
jgi:hypothetical protein